MKLIILDRDGVINYDSAHYIKSPQEWLPIPGSLAAIGKLKQLGYQIAIATNQSGIGRGFYSEATLETIHKKMQDALAPYGGAIDLICYCPHHPDDGCNCRKPKPGMLQTITDHFKPTQEAVLFVGDSQSDITAALNFGCQPVLVRTGNGFETAGLLGTLQHIQVYENLLNFVDELA